MESLDSHCTFINNMNIILHYTLSIQMINANMKAKESISWMCWKVYNIHTQQKYVPTYVWWIWYSLYFAMFVFLMARLIYYSYTSLNHSNDLHIFLCYRILRFLKVRSSYCIKILSIQHITQLHNLVQVTTFT